MRRAIVARSLAVCAVWLSATLAVQAQTAPPVETLAIAELRSLTLTRRDMEAEARQWEAERPQREAEMAAARERATAGPYAPEVDEAIVVSNHCGEAAATFRILRSTAPLPREFTITLSIGEFCDPPIDFDETAWLLVIDRNSGDLRERYPVFAWENDRLYAISEFGPGANHAPEVRRLLTPTPLPEPLEYTVFREGDALQRYVERRPSLELREGQVWLVSAIPVASIFPGFDWDDLWP